MARDHIRQVADGLKLAANARSVTKIYNSREIVAGDLPTFMNFCVFLKHPNDSRDGLVAFGWFSDDEDNFHEHSCIFSDHPDLVALFSSYFNILHRAASQVVLTDGTLPAQTTNSEPESSIS